MAEPKDPSFLEADVYEYYERDLRSSRGSQGILREPRDPYNRGFLACGTKGPSLYVCGIWPHQITGYVYFVCQ
jgi:hypothetical protein